MLSRELEQRGLVLKHRKQVTEGLIRFGTSGSISRKMVTKYTDEVGGNPKTTSIRKFIPKEMDSDNRTKMSLSTGLNQCVFFDTV